MILMILNGDSEQVLKTLDSDSVHLVFTSPPYFNARPEYSEYSTYQDYLDKMRKIIKEIHRVLEPGRFFAINTSPVLVPRKSRSTSSSRLAIPFDLHQIIVNEGYDFIDDIIWAKPEGAGCGRGRRFSLDRTPLQYKTVPVTEYILVYRKHTDKLIDWNIRKHDQELVEKSKVKDGYEKTNIWNISPTSDSRHPAIFPMELSDRIISYYSFVDDVVLDPFAGIGTTGKSAIKLGRKYILIEQNRKYYKIMTNEV